MPLGNDQVVIAPQSEVVPAPNQKVPTVQMWDMAEGPQSLKLKTVPQHLIPRDRPGGVWGPSDFMLLLVRSYGRHLCQTHGAASVEIIRHHQQPMPSVVLFPDNFPFPAGSFDEQTSNFGDIKP